MTDQDLKNKYQSVLDFMSRNGFHVQHFHVENGKAVLTEANDISNPDKIQVGQQLRIPAA